MSTELTGMDRWMALLQEKERTAEARAGAAVQSEAERGLPRAQELAPERSGELRGSRRVAGEGTSACVVFDAPYAAAVEEQTGFLSQAMAEAREGMAERVAATFSGNSGSGSGGEG